MKTLQEISQTKDLETVLQFVWNYLRQRITYDEYKKRNKEITEVESKNGELTSTSKDQMETQVANHMENGKNSEMVDVAMENKCPASFSEMIPEDNRIQCPVAQTVLTKALLSVDLLTRYSESSSHPEFIALINHIIKNDIIRPQFLRSYLDLKFLRSRKLIDMKYYSGWVKYRSYLVFATERFNLFQEESEGFIKLLVYFLETRLTRENLEKFVENIQSTIGALSLDPTRVLDILLDVYSMNLDNDLYLQVLEQCGAKFHYHELLGFKIKQYIRNQERIELSDENKTSEKDSASKEGEFAENKRINTFVPNRLLHLAATLVENGVMTTGDLIPYLDLHDPKLRTEVEQIHRKQFEVAEDLASVSLSADSIANTTRPYRSDIPQFQLPDYYLHHPSLNFIAALLQKGMFANAYHLMIECKDYILYLHPEIRRGLFTILEGEMNRIITKQNFGTISFIDNLEDLSNSLRLNIYPIIQFLGIGLHYNSNLVVMVSRILLSLQESGHQDILGGNFSMDDSRNIYFHILCILSQCRCAMSSNSQLSYYLWSILKNLDYSERYAVYENVNIEYEENFLMKQYAAVVTKRTNDIMKKMTKDDAKAKSRLLVQFIHSNPLIVCERILSQVQVYDNLINPLSELVRWFSQESMDIMTYTILKKFEPEGYKPRLKSDDITIQNWITNIGSFAGKLLRKYSFSWNQMYPVFKYVFCKLKQGVWEDSAILVELLKEVVSEEVIEDISKTQLEAYGGSRTLQKLAASFQTGDSTQISYSKDSISKLSRALKAEDVGGELLILLSSYSANASFAGDYESSLTFLSTSKDKTHTAFVSLLRFLVYTFEFRFEDDSSMDTSDETSNIIPIPPLNTLREARIPSANSFAICRPIVKKSLSSLLTFVDGFSQFALNDDEEVETTWSGISKELYTFFWTFDLYDINVPTSAYETQIQKQEAEKKFLEERREKSTNNDEKNKISIEIQKCAETIETLKHDLDIHSKRFEDISTFIASHIELLCTQQGKDDFMESFVEKCVYPRSLFSIIDALYCTKFMELVAKSSGSTFTFNVTRFFEAVLDYSPAWLCFTTEMEAVRIGALLESCLSLANDLSPNENKNLIEEVKEKSSFFIKEHDESFDIEGYKEKHFMLHSLVSKRFSSLLKKTGSPHYQRNALLVLNRITEKFPKYLDHASELEEIIEGLTKLENDSTLPLAQRYQSNLKTIKSSLWKFEKKEVMLPEKKQEALSEKKVVPAEKDVSTPTNKNQNVQPEKELTVRKPPSQATNEAPEKKTSATKSQKEHRKKISPPRTRPQNSPKRTETKKTIEKSESSKKRERVAPPPSLSDLQGKSKGTRQSDHERRFEKKVSPPRSGRGDYSRRGDQWDSRDIRDSRDLRDTRDIRDQWETRDSREGRSRDLRSWDNTDSPRRDSGREIRDVRDSSRRDDRFETRSRFSRKRSREPEESSRKSYRDNSGRKKYR